MGIYYGKIKKADKINWMDHARLFAKIESPVWSGQSFCLKGNNK
jgi:hypothetical protein